MSSWAEFELADPALALRVKERFGIRKHKTLATLRADGAPRISGIETAFEDGELLLGMMPGSRKLADLERDPRLALHSPTEDAPDDEPGGWRGEAKLSGAARLVPFPNSPVAGAMRFRVDVKEVSYVHLNEAADRLVVESWSESRGSRRLERE